LFYGEYLINAQGEDVVAGVRTPHPIADLAKQMPAAHDELMNVRSTLEQHFKDMQDLEFTVEENRLYILQTRNGKRTGHAAVRIETSPEDLRGMIAAEGVLTSRGGVSSHAALVARQMGKVCVCGATGLQIDYQKGTLSGNGTTLNRGDYISIDGTAGEVFAGE